MKSDPRILIVEDNPDDQYMVKRVLREVVNLKIDLAENGLEAIEYLKSHESELPHLIFLDVKMPHMGGMEALCLIREFEALKYLPIIIFSSSCEPSDIAEAMSCNATEYVQKPVDFDRYNQTVRELVKRYMGI